MKKLRLIIFCILFICVLSGCGQAENSVLEKKFTVNYLSTDGGYIGGKSAQFVTPETYSEMVRAVPYEGYEFVGWSDGLPHENRADMIYEDFTVTAIFNKFEFQVNYAANIGGAIIGETSQTIKYGEDAQTVTAVPMQGYEFIGWSDGVQIADRKDVSIKRDVEVRANFATKDAIRFPILMVFVTEVHAELELKDGSVFNAEFVMTPSEKKINDLIPYKVTGFLNDAFAGEVVFDIDTYYTQNPLGRENLSRGIDYWFDYVYGVDTESITEIKDKIENYRSVITTISYRDYEFVTLAGGGASSRKIAEIYADVLWGGLYNQGGQPKYLLDFNDESVNTWWVGSILDTYIHEFTHTAEMYYSYTDLIPLDLHGYISYYIGQNDGRYDIEAIKQYLVGKACVDGNYIGIPKSFWADEPII